MHLCCLTYCAVALTQTEGFALLSPFTWGCVIFGEVELAKRAPGFVHLIILFFA